jgi:hypothetical protein
MALLDRCNPRLITVDESCGCTLTRASIQAFTAADFEAQGLKEVGADKLIAQTKELRMAGVREKPMTDLFLSRMRGGKRGILGEEQGRQSVIAPFVLVPQESVVNSNYWVVSGGAAHPGAGAGSIPASAWNFTISNTSSPFASALVNIEKYFLPGKYVVVFASSGAGAAKSLQYKIIASANASPTTATVSVVPNFSAAGWAALSAPDKAAYQVTAGVLVQLANSVSDYEAYCYQYPAENTRKLRDFWWQTVRDTWCYNDEYVKALTAPLTSGYWKNFRTLPLAQQRKRQGEQSERDLYNTLFYGQRIDETQTVNGYTSLPQVVDPANGSCVMEYKANTLGFRTQIDECGRVLDMNGAALDLDVVKGLLYQLRRYRGSSGMVEIDMMGDRLTYANVQYAFIGYLKERYGVDTTRFYQPNQKIQFNGQVMWNYDKFEFPEDGVIVNFIHDDAFDDLIAAAPDATLKSRVRALWCIDWSDIAIKVADVKSVNRQTNTADNLYNCVIQPNVTHYQLQSKTLMVQVGDANRHLVVENFSAGCPTLSATPCS